MEDYKQRFYSEYKDTLVRTPKFIQIVSKAHQGILEFELNCPVEVLNLQVRAMSMYLDILRLRAEKYEDIDLTIFEGYYYLTDEELD